MNSVILEDLDLICNSDIDWSAFRNKTVLISGAYGMLPSYMVYTLIHLNETYPDMNIRIVAVVRSRQKLLDRFGEYINKSYFKTVIADIKNVIDLDGKIDFIIHGASPASSQYYSTMPVDVILPNILGTYNLLELAKKNNSSSFLFFSSGEVYGNLHKDEIFENDIGSVDPMDVRSCYAESKRMGENLCRCYAHQYGLNIKIVRPSHTYGPTLDLKNDNRVFAEFVSNAVNGEDIVMKSDGMAERTFCYISDATIAYFTVMLKGGSGEAYNVSDKNACISIKKLAELIVELPVCNGLKVTTKQRERGSNYLENKFSKHPVMNTDKLESLGWASNFDVVGGFDRTIKSFIDKNGGGRPSNLFFFDISTAAQQFGCVLTC